LKFLVEPTNLNPNRISSKKSNGLKCIDFFNGLAKKWWRGKKGRVLFLSQLMFLDSSPEQRLLAHERNELFKQILLFTG
jgi:hypothetical protein